MNGQDQDIKAFVAERDAVLNSSYAEFLVYSAMRGINYSTEEVAEATFHKARTRSLGVKPELRAASHRWLLERGFSSFTDSEK